MDENENHHGHDCDDPDCAPFGEDDEPSGPDFGCACENALVVDTMCQDCIYSMRRQEAEADGGLRWLFWRMNERLETMAWSLASWWRRWRNPPPVDYGNEPPF